MGTSPHIDTAWHPLATGCPPEWASGWGEDRYGVFVEFTLADVTTRLRWIRPGQFIMGSSDGKEEGGMKAEPGRFRDEGPRHLVTIARGFWLFDTPCTQTLWQAVLGDNPSRFQTPTRPVEQVSWEDVQRFLRRINSQVPGLDLMLPSEAQWEYACRAGTETAIYTGDLAIRGERDAPALDPIAWYGGNSGIDFDLEIGDDSSRWMEKQHLHGMAGTRRVGTKRGNAWGLYDMLGNVWEWTRDQWHEDYRGAPADGLAWEDGGSGAARVVRGGSWLDYARLVRAAYRHSRDPAIRLDSVGFRCARVQA